MITVRATLTALLLTACTGAETDPDNSDTNAVVDTTTTTTDGLYDVTWSITPDPHTAGATCTLAFSVEDEDEAVAMTSVDVTPWMTSMDHGIMGEVTLTEISTGSYEASWVYPMSGAWDITVDLTGAPGTDTVEIALDVQ